MWEGLRDLLDYLGRPQQALFGGVKYLEQGQNPMEGAWAGLSGREQFRGADLLPQDMPGRSLAGLGLDLFADPLAALGPLFGTLGKLGKAGKAVEAGADLAHALRPAEAATEALRIVPRAEEAASVVRPIESSLAGIPRQRPPGFYSSLDALKPAPNPLDVLDELMTQIGRISNALGRPAHYVDRFEFPVLLHGKYTPTLRNLGTAYHMERLADVFEAIPKELTSGNKFLTGYAHALDPIPRKKDGTLAFYDFANGRITGIGPAIADNLSDYGRMNFTDYGVHPVAETPIHEVGHATHALLAGPNRVEKLRQTHSFHHIDLPGPGGKMWADLHFDRMNESDSAFYAMFRRKAPRNTKEYPEGFLEKFFPSWYAAVNPEEDFAESFVMYMTVPEELRASFPDRFEFLQHLLGNLRMTSEDAWKMP